MRKSLTFLFSVLFTYTSFAQIKGVTFTDALPMKARANYGQLLFVEMSPGKRNYMYMYKTSQEGLKQCVEKTQEIVSLNDLKFNYPNSTNSDYFASYVTNIFDYGTLYKSLRDGSSEVNRGWKTKSNDTFVLSLDKSGFMLLLYPNKNNQVINTDIISLIPLETKGQNTTVFKVIGKTTKEIDTYTSKWKPWGNFESYVNYANTYITLNPNEKKIIINDNQKATVLKVIGDPKISTRLIDYQSVKNLDFPALDEKYPHVKVTVSVQLYENGVYHVIIEYSDLIGLDYLVEQII